MKSNTTFSPAQQIILLWLIITLGMLLHQFFSLHNLRFGADVIKRGYATTPTVELVKRLTLYVLPLGYMGVTAFFQHRIVRVLHLIASPFYLAFHIHHFVHEWGKMKDPVQWVLLSFLIVFSGLLVFTAYRWAREK
ncbi:MAG: hypothetical protein JJU02_10045 [Cryomorphaceae bacterium]|nr:hypothetical protein [Cryomorphaceae bacterium]